MAHEVDEAFDEDECTLDFGEEEEENDLGKSGLFKEYHGEDYSKYLDEEVETNDPTIDKPYTHWRLPPEALELQGDTYMSHAEQNGSTRRQSLTNLKQKVEKFFTSGRSKKSKESPTNSSAPKMYEFSYADSKIGSSILNGGTGASIDSGCDTKSGPPLESRSDLGLTTNRSSWWDVETLSVRKSSKSRNSITTENDDINANSVSRRRRKSKSVTNLTNIDNVDNRQSSHGSSIQTPEPVTVDSSAIWMPMTSDDSTNGTKSRGKLSTALRRMSKGFTKSDKTAISTKS